jgi:hypothetical protein
MKRQLNDRQREENGVKKAIAKIPKHKIKQTYTRNQVDCIKKRKQMSL